MNNFPKSEPVQGSWGKAKLLEADEDEDEDEDKHEERGRIHAGRFSASRRAISGNVAAKSTIVNSSTVLILILIFIFIFILFLFRILRFKKLFPACCQVSGLAAWGMAAEDERDWPVMFSGESRNSAAIPDL